MSDPFVLTVNDKAVETVRDHVLLAAIGPDWRERIDPVILHFWTGEIRAALEAARRRSLM